VNEPEPNPPPEKATWDWVREPRKIPPLYEPPLEVRMAWWFGIAGWPLLAALFTGPGALLFPVGLLGAFQPQGGFSSVGLVPLIVISYGAYFVHFVLTLLLRRKEHFQILRAILIAMVVANVAGCAAEFHNFNSAFN